MGVLFRTARRTRLVEPPTGPAAIWWDRGARDAEEATRIYAEECLRAVVAALERGEHDWAAVIARLFADSVAPDLSERRADGRIARSWWGISGTASPDE